MVLELWRRSTPRCTNRAEEEAARARQQAEGEQGSSTHDLAGAQGSGMRDPASAQGSGHRRQQSACAGRGHLRNPAITRGQRACKGSSKRKQQRFQWTTKVPASRRGMQHCSERTARHGDHAPRHEYGAWCHGGEHTIPTKPIKRRGARRVEDLTGRDPCAARREASPDRGTTRADDAALGAVDGSTGEDG